MKLSFDIEVTYGSISSITSVILVAVVIRIAALTQVHYNLSTGGWIDAQKNYGVGCGGWLVPQLWRGGEQASKKDAESMVKKAVAAYKPRGESFCRFYGARQRYVNKDLYIVVYDFSGKCIAHGQNAKQVGKDLIGMKDPDGKAFVKERVDLAKAKGSFWQEYKFTDPLTKKVLPKVMYCEKADDKAIICGGVYKE
jgi:hypothetical protein